MYGCCECFHSIFGSGHFFHIYFDLFIFNVSSSTLTLSISSHLFFLIWWCIQIDKQTNKLAKDTLSLTCQDYLIRFLFLNSRYIQTHVKKMSHWKNLFLSLSMSHTHTRTNIFFIQRLQMKKTFSDVPIMIFFESLNLQFISYKYFQRKKDLRIFSKFSSVFFRLLLRVWI